MSLIDNTQNGEAFDYTVGHGTDLHSHELIHLSLIHI